MPNPVEQDIAKRKILSVIVPTYNYGNLIGKAINSYAGQAEENSELIIINDGSTDNTDEIISEFTKSVQFNYKKTKNNGVSAARNLGVKQALGEYILFLDADDFLAPGAIKLILESVRDSHGQVILFGNYTINSQGAKKYHAPPRIPNRTEPAFKAYGNRDFGLSFGSIVIKRDHLKAISFPEGTTHAEDQPVFALLLANYSFRSIDSPTCVIFKHADSRRRDFQAAMNEDISMITYLFQHPMMPDSLKRYQCLYVSSRYLSIFRTLYNAEKYREALIFYLKAIYSRPAAILKFRYLQKALKSVPKMNLIQGS